MNTMQKTNSWLWAIAAGLVAVLGSTASADQGIDFNTGDYNRPNIPDKLTGKGGLHIKPGRRVSFNHTLKDGGGFQWDLNYYLCVYRGTNQAYGGAMYLNVNNHGNVRCYNFGWRNQAGDEVEIFDRYSHKRYGTSYRKGLKVFRRVKVYKDKPLARWLEIFHNPTNKPITVKVKLYSNFYSGFEKWTTSDGDAKWESDEKGFVTKQSRDHAPSVMHVVGDKRSRSKTKVDKSNSYVNVHYTVTVPANDVRILCTFQSQGNNYNKLLSRLRTFRAWKYMRDLRPDLRRKVLNFGRLSGYADIDLLRSESSDRVFLANGDPLLGEVTTREFRVQTSFGMARLPAADVIGMAMQTDEKGRPDPNGVMKVLLRGGHLLRGTLKDQKLRFAVGEAKLEIPFHHMAQWSFRVSKDRPEYVETPPPRILLRSGFRLPIDMQTLTLPVRSQLGRIDVQIADVHQVTFDPNDPNSCTVSFLSGSTLTGRADANGIATALPLEGHGTVPLASVAKIIHTNVPPEGTANATLTLRKTLDAVVSEKKQTVLSGTLANEEIVLLIGDKRRSFDPAVVKELKFQASPNDPVTLTTWNSGNKTGLLQTRTIRLRMGAGSVVSVDANECALLKRAHMTAPANMTREADQWIDQLGHADRRKREEATRKLKQMNKIILPELKKAFGKSRDPEVRARLETVIEHFGGSTMPSEK
jgi:hypothetical protein